MTALFTAIQSTQTLSKKIYLDEQSVMRKEAAAALRDGDFVVHSVKDLRDFAFYLDQATPNIAFTYGVPKNLRGKITAQALVDRTPGAISRTRQNFGWAQGPGILMIDDDSGTPIPDFIGLLRTLVPFLSDADILTRPSSSSLIHNTETGEEIQGLRNRRAYVMVSDAAKIPEIGQLIDEHLWLAGHGSFKVSVSGALLPRNLVDTAVWSPEHLDFVGGAVCTPPLAQGKLFCTFSQGQNRMIDAAKLPILSSSQSKKLTQLKTAARNAKEQAAADQREKYIALRTAELVERGASNAAATSTIRTAVETSTLGLDFPVHLETGTILTIQQLLQDPSSYHGKRCGDPLEPTYRNDPRVGYISLINGSRPFIYSHAHGGVKFLLQQQRKQFILYPGLHAKCSDDLAELFASSFRAYSLGDVSCWVQDDGSTKTLNTHSTKQIAGTCFDIVKAKGDVGLVSANLPDEIANMFLASSAPRRLPPLSAVLTSPTITPEGRLISQPGYDEQSKLLLISREHEPWPEVTALAAEELEKSFNALWHPFKDFPFDSPESKSAMVAALLTAVCRPTLPTSPAIGFDAPSAGSGKTKLAQCLAILSCGQGEVTPVIGDEDELRKKLTSALLTGKQVILFDNMEASISSPTLAGFITSPDWSDRLLGGNSMMKAQNRALVILTGNNLNPLRDLVRRILIVRIDPRMEATQVWQRSYDLEPVSYVTEHRQELVAAALSLMLSFVAEGMPRNAKGRLASFEQWDDLVRQCVVWLGMRGVGNLIDPIVQMNNSAAQDPDTASLGALLECWHTVLGSAPQEASTLCMTTKMYGVLNEIALDRQGQVSARALGQYFQKHQGRIVGGFRLDRIRGRANTLRWSVAKVSSIQSGGFGGNGGEDSARSGLPGGNSEIFTSLEVETVPPLPPLPPSVSLPPHLAVKHAQITTGAVT
jgi:hypothetical protein